MIYFTKKKKGRQIPFAIPASDTHQFNLNVIEFGQIALSSLEIENENEDRRHEIILSLVVLTE